METLLQLEYDDILYKFKHTASFFSEAIYGTLYNVYNLQKRYVTIVFTVRGSLIYLHQSLAGGFPEHGIFAFHRRICP